MRSQLSSLARLALLPPIAAATLLSCGLFDSGGGGGGNSRAAVLEVEPNDELGDANPLTLVTPVKGDVVDDEDQDWFRIRLNAGRTVQIELFGTRLDQATWETAATVPRLTMYFPDDETKVLEHSAAAGWTFGAHDFDIPLFRVPTTGFYWIVIRADADLSPGGSYALRINYVMPPPSQLELEQPLDTGVDDTPGTAQTISPGTLSGFHREGNDDYYAVTASSPRVLRIEVVGQRNGAFDGEITYYDPLLRLYDIDGTTLLAENDDAFFGDPAIQHQVAGSGTYYVQVTQSPTSTVDSPYFLRIAVDPAGATAESEPNGVFGLADPIAYGQAVSGSVVVGDEDWFRFTGTRGDMVRLQVFDSANSQAATEAIDAVIFEVDGFTPVPFHRGPEFQVMSTILQQNGTFFVRAVPGPLAIAGTAYRLELNRFKAAPYETEPNDAVATAGPFPGGKLAAGVIALPGDSDFYRFTTRDGEVVTFAAYAGNTGTVSDGFSEYSGHGSDLVPLLVIRDELGAVVAASTSAPGGTVYTESVFDGLPTASVAFVAPPTSRTFYLEVTSSDGSGTDFHYYVAERR